MAEYVQRIKDECEADGRPFPLHKWVHHGLSSQAMLFNLLGPLVVQNDLTPLAAVFAQQGLAWPAGAVRAAFEYEDRTVFNEDVGQPTSIDLVLEDAAGPRVFVESKLVEREFGACSVFLGGDCDGRNPAADPSQCYLHHIGRRYWPVLRAHGFLQGRMATDATCLLANHYQFFREVGLALQKEGVFVLLSDERSPTFWCDGPHGPRGLMTVLLDLVPEALRDRVGRITVQQVVNAIRATGRHPWIGEFESRYALPDALGVEEERTCP